MCSRSEIAKASSSSRSDPPLKTLNKEYVAIINKLIKYYTIRLSLTSIANNKLSNVLSFASLLIKLSKTAAAAPCHAMVFIPDSCLRRTQGTMG